MASTPLGLYYVTIAPTTKGMGKEIESELNGADIGKGFGNNFLDSVKGLAIGTALGNLITSGIQVAAGAAKQIFTDAFQGYADFQQNVGGVQKLYGNMGMSVEEYAKSMGKSVSEVQGDWQKLENAQNTVLKNAQGAYKITGMSANQYMETATSFSAALINSLGGDTEAAAAQTQVAMQAISDNWNTFGGDLGMVQQAYQGFAKQNYTMLDNLKLGYGGTKTEMERLIQDANAWAEANGKAADLSIESFSDVVTAIQYIQEKQNIAGTTAREATETISGSLGMLSASWANFLTELGNSEGDIAARVTELAESLGIVAKNVIPVIFQIGSSALQALPQLVGQAFTELKNLLLPKIDELTGGAGTKFMEFAGRIGQYLAPVGEAFSMVFGKAREIVQNITPGLQALAGGAMKVLEGAARAVGFAFEALMPVISFVADLFGGALKAAIDVVAGAFNVVGDVVNGLADIFTPIAEFIIGKMQEIADKLAPIVEGIGGIVGGIGDFFQDPLKAIGDFVTGGTKDMESMQKSTKKVTTQMQKQTKSTFDTMAVTAKTATTKIASQTSADMKSATTSVNTQTDAQKERIRANYEEMRRRTDAETKSMASTVKTKLAEMKNDTNTNMNAMQTTASEKMSSLARSVLDKMNSAASTTATKTKSMQASIDGLKGKTVDLGVKKAGTFDSILNAAKSAVSGLTGKTAQLGAEKAKGFDSAIQKAQDAINNIRGRTGANAVQIAINAYQTGIRGVAINESYSNNNVRRVSVDPIPMKAATGGILTSATPLLAGEDGTEAIIPLSNKRYVRPFAQAVASEMDAGGRGVNINIAEMNVRKESDINTIANRLNTLVNRSNGGRL